MSRYDYVMKMYTLLLDQLVCLINFNQHFFSEFLSNQLDLRIISLGLTLCSFSRTKWEKLLRLEETRLRGFAWVRIKNLTPCFNILFGIYLKKIVVRSNFFPWIAKSSYICELLKSFVSDIDTFTYPCFRLETMSSDFSSLLN